MPRYGTGATGTSVAQQKQVVVETVDFERREAVTVDSIGNRHRVSIDTQRVGIIPLPNDVWMVDKDWGPWTFSALLTPQPYRRRKSIYTTQPDLVVGETERGLISLSTHYLILYIQTSIPARVRLYTNLADQEDDLTRNVTTLPKPGCGIVMDYLTHPVLLEAPLTPVPHGLTFGMPPTGRIPISVTPVNGGPVTVTLTWVTEE